MISSKHYSQQVNSVCLFIGVVSLLLSNIQTSFASSITTSTPSIVPLQGGTILFITGEGFESGSPECQLILSDGVIAIDENTIHNDTHMTCTLPSIPDSYIPVIIDDDYVVELDLTGISDFVYLTFFDLQEVIITHISPNWTYTSTETNITIHGVGLINSSEITCHSVLFDVPATFVNTSFLMCLLPVYPITTQIMINVYITGQASSEIQTIAANSTVFTYFATPPNVIGARFNPSYAFILLEFDREVEIGGENDYNTSIELACEFVFTPEVINVSLGGPEAKCFWHNTQQRQVVIELTDNSNILPNMSLSLKDRSIRTRYVTFSKHTSGNIVVQADTQVLYPIAVIEGSQYIPYCGNISLNAEKSQYGGSQPLLYLWKVTDNSEITTSAPGENTEDELIPDIPDVQEHLSGYFTTNPYLVLPTDLFYEGITYNISLTVMNFLGLTDIEQALLTKLTYPAPNVWIIGSRERTINPNSSVLIQGRAVVSGCDGLEPRFTFNWVLSENNMIIAINDVYVNGPSIHIPANTLSESKTYHITLQVSVGGQTGNANLTIHTVTASIEANIYGGHLVTYGMDDNIILDATTSPGLTKAIKESDSFVVIWNCSKIEANDVVGVPCIDLHSEEELHISSDLRTYIAPYTLSPDLYTITLHLYYDAKEVSSAIQIIRVKDDTGGPIVFLKQPSNSNHLQVQRTLIIDGVVQSDLEGLVTWSSVYKPGYAFLPLENTSSINTPISNNIVSGIYLTQSSETKQLYFISNITSPSFINPISLTIPAYHLLPNNNYLFRLTTTNIKGTERYAEIELNTESLPSSGKILVFPSIGEAIVNHFKIRAQYWTDDIGDLPVYYRFGFSFSVNNSNNVIWLTGVQEENELITRLPIPLNNTSILLVTQIFDSYGAANEYTQPIILTSPIHRIDLEDINSKIYNLANDQGQWMEALSDLTTVLYSIDSGLVSITNTMSIEDFKLSVLNLLIELHRTQIPPTKPLYLLELQIIQSLTSQIEISENVIKSLLKIIEEIVNYYTSYDNFIFCDRGFTEREAQLIIDIYSNLIAYNSQSDGNRIQSNCNTESFAQMSQYLGFGICQLMGVYDSSVILANINLGTLKSYRSILPWMYNVSCNLSESNDCPFSFNVQPTSIIFGKRVFEKYTQYSCDEYGDIDKPRECQSVCITTVQLISDIHWSGSPYSNHIKSLPIHVYLTTHSGTIIDDYEPLEPVTLQLQLIIPKSETGSLECVWWNENEKNWSSEGCTTSELSEGIECQCNHFNEVAVIDHCPSGYCGIECNKVCPEGLYGHECSMICECSIRGTCLAHDGSCDCEPGWIDKTCETICPFDQWGENCLNQCLCENDGVCNNVKGNCTCLPGWIGQYCEIECPDGYFGKDCDSICTCRTDIECDKITGNCTCQSGYTGVSCHEICPNGFYGENCSTYCECYPEGTVRCDHINGTCSCSEMWSGVLCDIRYSPSPSPSPSTEILLVKTSFPVWLIAVPVVLAVIMSVVAIVTILVCCKLCKKCSGKSQVLPISEKGSRVKSGFEELPVLKEEEEDTLEMTDGQSLKVRIQGIALKDLFSKDSNVDEFKEPELIGRKERWQIIQIIPSSTPTPTTSPTMIMDSKDEEEMKEKEKLNVESGIEVESITSADETPEIHPTPVSMVTQVYQIIQYKKGVYMDKNASLKDLRNAFVDSKQLDDTNVYFQFLHSDTSGDYIAIDNEEETLLSSLEPNLQTPRTVYFESIKNSLAALELCSCGKFAELECTECRAKGYCSDICQQKDWLTHSATCRIVSARRRKDKRLRKKKRMLEKKTKEIKHTGYTPRPDVCICGCDAEYECSECGRQGYCSQKCQEEDWELHQLFCTVNAESFPMNQL